MRKFNSLASRNILNRAVIVGGLVGSVALGSGCTPGHKAPAKAEDTSTSNQGGSNMTNQGSGHKKHEDKDLTRKQNRELRNDLRKQFGATCKQVFTAYYKGEATKLGFTDMIGNDEAHKYEDFKIPGITLATNIANSKAAVAIFSPEPGDTIRSNDCSAAGLYDFASDEKRKQYEFGFENLKSASSVVITSPDMNDGNWGVLTHDGNNRADLPNGKDRQNYAQDSLWRSWNKMSHMIPIEQALLAVQHMTDGQ